MHVLCLCVGSQYFCCGSWDFTGASKGDALQLTFTCLKTTKETLEKVVKSVQVNSKSTRATSVTSF